MVHYMGYPANMDVARKHGLKAVEDVSHAQDGLYKGRKLGSIGDAEAMSLMSDKSLAVVESGMLVTNEPEVLRTGGSLWTLRAVSR